MAQEKAKKTIKVRDLKPTKDAKGGRKHHHRTTVKTVNDGGWGPDGAGKWDY